MSTNCWLFRNVRVPDSDIRVCALVEETDGKVTGLSLCTEAQLNAVVDKVPEKNIHWLVKGAEA